MTTIVTPMHGCMHDDIEIIPLTGAVHCTNCGMWWYDADADTSVSEANASANASRQDTYLNPDNEPTSEHNQWREDDNG